MIQNYFNETRFAVTVCDVAGIILYMNDKSMKTFEKYGGKDLIGQNILDYHPEHAKAMIHDMLLKHKDNSYTIEKNGIKKMIHQTPWFEGGAFMGFIELSIEIPFDIPNFIRQ